MKKITVPIGAFSIGFDDVFDALEATVCPGIGAVLNHVHSGGILRLDAVRGESLPAGTVLNGEGDKPVGIDVEGWYGIVEGAGFHVGPFERKSQAMNGVVLVLMGLNVIPNRVAPPAVAAYDLEADLVSKGVDADIATRLAANVKERFGDGAMVGQVVGGGSGAGMVEVLKPTLN